MLLVLPIHIRAFTLFEWIVFHVVQHSKYSPRSTQRISTQRPRSL